VDTGTTKSVLKYDGMYHYVCQPAEASLPYMNALEYKLCLMLTIVLGFIPPPPPPHTHTRIHIHVRSHVDGVCVCARARACMWGGERERETEGEIESHPSCHG
jgi:hypothetical protein